MANKPVLGLALCPRCGTQNPVVWNGNRKHRCMHCGKAFQIKRQKLRNVMPIRVPKED